METFEDPTLDIDEFKEEEQEPRSRSKNRSKKTSKSPKKSKLERKVREYSPDPNSQDALNLTFVSSKLTDAFQVFLQYVISCCLNPQFLQDLQQDRNSKSFFLINLLFNNNNNS